MLSNEELLMKRCISLAKKGLGSTSPNPMVGAVIVCDNKIIGEGFHKNFGKNHAEVEAINSVKNKKLLKKSTLYVNLEPCNHYGKTPPCSELIIKKKIPIVIIGTSDPNPKVSGLGIQKLKNNNINVKVGVLEDECDKLNKRFFCYHKNKRPYIILKWAQSEDGFISPVNQKKGEIFWITSTESRQITHKWRSEEDTIAVGINTIYKDNPELTTRYWNGKSPTPIIIDPNNRIKPNSKVLKKHNKIYHFIDKKIKINNKHSIHINFKKSIHELLNNLHENKVNSILVEGGRKTIQKFIDYNFWDEARCFVGKKKIYDGIKAPEIKNKEWIKKTISTDLLYSVINYSPNKL